MAKNIIAIGSFIGFDKATNDIIATSNSLTTAGLDLAVTMDEIRGGISNPIQGYLPHSSSFGVNAEDCLFDMNYVALNCGGDITSTADVMTTETITTSTANKITVTNTPVAMAGNTAVVGWYKLASSTEDAWTTITFVGKDATVSLPSGSEVCVKYFYSNASARKFTVSSAFIPKVIRAVITYTLYATSQSGTGTSNAKIGELIVEIPNFQFNGTQSLSISSSGATTSPISGNALVTYTGSCNGTGYYALIKEVITNKDTFANVTMIGVADGSIDLSASYATETIKVYGFYNDGTAPSLLDNSLLTFTSGTTGTATVGSRTGIVQRVAAGSSLISIKVTSKPSLSTTANVTSV